MAAGVPPPIRKPSTSVANSSAATVRTVAARLPSGKRISRRPRFHSARRTRAAVWRRIIGAPRRAPDRVHFFPGSPARGSAPGMILLERHAADAPFTPYFALRQLGWAGGQLGRAMLAATTHREVPFRRVLTSGDPRAGHVETPPARAARRCGWVSRCCCWCCGCSCRGRCAWRAIASSNPGTRSTVAAETSGKIEHVYVEEGQFVEKDTRSSPSWKTTTCARRWP